MRTKALIAAAAILAAGAASSMAQSNVYSLNVVGYVNKSFTGGLFYLITNPLKGTNNALSTIMPAPPNGTYIYTWNPAIADFGGNYSYNGGAWDFPNATLPPGQGVLFTCGANFTNTFVGEVQQGSVTNPLTFPSGQFQIVGSQVPVSGSVPSVMTGFPAVTGDTIYSFDPLIADFGGQSAFTGTWDTSSITNIPVGDAFLLYRSGATTTWTRNFTVN